MGVKAIEMTVPIFLETPSIFVRHENEVPLWTVEDVESWVTRVGFQDYSSVFKDCGVDGDMLLQLNDQDIKDDIGITNGILRKRFMRELHNLKKNADYTSCDGGLIANFLNKISSEFRVYTYNLILKELTLDFLRRLNDQDLEDMLQDAGVTSAIHRHKIVDAVMGPDEDDPFVDSFYNDPPIDVYLSYPVGDTEKKRQGAADLASLVKMQLQRRNLSVFSDSHDNSPISDNVLTQIRDSRYYLLVLPQGGLDSCLHDVQGNDRLHTEIAAALASETKIIPVTVDFQWPAPEELPEDIRGLAYFNGVRWVHDYQDACIDKLERFIRGESNLRVESPFSVRSGYTRSRGDSGRSTPTHLSPILMQKYLKQRTTSIDSALGSQSLT